MEVLNQNLGERLMELGLITQQQLDIVYAQQERTRRPMYEILLQLEYVEEDALIDFFSKELNLEKIDLSESGLNKEVVDLIPYELAIKHKVISFEKKDNILHVAIANPLEEGMRDYIQFYTGSIVEFHLATQKQILEVIEAMYSQKHTKAKELGGKNKDADAFGADKPSVIKLVDLLLLEAVKAHASDIHVESKNETLSLRFRVDGVLHEIAPPSKSLFSAIVSRIKIMANLDIAEKRVPQDGRFHWSNEKHNMDVRVSIIPMVFGENIVLRLLDRSTSILTLEELGFADTNFTRYKEFIKSSFGIILVCGPTGSGKTTSLYASLKAIKSAEKKIVTIEDPAEYHLDFADQIQVNSRVGLTFASGLRSVLRHDPDIIMVGEIRDLETAQIAIQAALTGHLVFSTLHTNDAASAATRLIDMGIEPFLISSCVRGIVAQRLVRVICPDCKIERKVEENVLRQALGLSLVEKEKDKQLTIYSSMGCTKCMHTGFTGRIGIFELLSIDDKVHDLILKRASSEEIRKAGFEKFPSMIQDGFNKILAGLTTTDEVLRVISA